jgi:cullin 1
MPDLEDKKKSEERVQEDRTFAIEAAIVRTMKARKVLRHTELVGEVLQQLHMFKPNPRVTNQNVFSFIFNIFYFDWF